MRVKEIFREFQWNPALSKKDFDFKVPENYGTLNMGDAHVDERGAIEGFRAYAGLTGGRYPGDLAFDTAANEMRSDRDRLQAEGQWDEKSVQELFKFRNTSAFYGTLIENDVEVE